MGARVSTIWFVDTPDPAVVLQNAGNPDFEASRAVAESLFPEMELAPTGVMPLINAAGVTDDVLFVGAFPGVVVICHKELSSSTPKATAPRWRSAIRANTTYLVASRPEDAWGSFAVWEGDKLARSFSSVPVTIFEDDGIPLLWERPYWAGEFPLAHPPGVLPDPQSLPFHPQQFAEAANIEWLGFRYTGSRPEGETDPSFIGVHGFTVHQPGQAPRTAPPVAPAVDAATGNADTQQDGSPAKRSLLDRFRKKKR
ncbi:DUF6928 family protein [Rhodococcus sp. NPDC058521]|uniref:DUF6928 family protein n=1 Tax=Rhodococcus sp. NPDC058521 TaxID=3346536 RepID=UPI003660A75A